MTTRKQDAAEDRREAARRADEERLTHLVDPMTHPSAGDPPPAMTPTGERLGVIPVHRNAQADLAQAQEEGRQAGREGLPTKAERASARAGKAGSASPGSRSDKPSGASKPEKPAERQSGPTFTPPLTVTKDPHKR